MSLLKKTCLLLGCAFILTNCEIGPETDLAGDSKEFPLTETAWLSDDGTNGFLISPNLEIHELTCWHNEVTLEETVGHVEVEKGILYIDTGAQFTFDTDGTVLLLSNENGPLAEYLGGQLGMGCPFSN